MFGRRPKTESKITEGAPRSASAETRAPSELKDAMRQARIDAADRSAVVVDLRDAEVARLDLLNDALDPIFLQVPDDAIDLFDRGLNRGDTPRLWIDAVAHVHMGHDKRVYRFVQDTRHGRVVLAESVVGAEIVDAVTKYIARRLIERERALSETSAAPVAAAPQANAPRGMSAGMAFLVGAVAGAAALIAFAWLMAPSY